MQECEYIWRLFDWGLFTSLEILELRFRCDTMSEKVPTLPQIVRP